MGIDIVISKRNNFLEEFKKFVADQEQLIHEAFNSIAGSKTLSAEITHSKRVLEDLLTHYQCEVENQDALIKKTLENKNLNDAYIDELFSKINKMIDEMKIGVATTLSIQKTVLELIKSMINTATA